MVFFSCSFFTFSRFYLMSMYFLSPKGNLYLKKKLRRRRDGDQKWKHTQLERESISFHFLVWVRVSGADAELLLQALRIREECTGPQALGHFLF